MYDHAVIQVGTTVYLIGGNTGSSINSSAIYSGTISTTGNISGWTDTNNPLPVALAGMAYCATSTAIYLIGGYTWTGTTQTEVDTVYMIPITSTGTLGTPVLLTPTVPVFGYNCSAIVMGDMIYVSTCSTNLYQCLINSDNTINDFGLFGNPLPSYTSNGGLLLTYGSFLYYIGSTTGNTHQCNIELNSVSPWMAIPTILPASYYNMSGFIGNGYMGLLGGSDGSPLNNIYSFNYTDNNYYSLHPRQSLSALPNSIYLLGNLVAKGLIGDTSTGDVLSELLVSNRGISSAVVTYEYNPVFANNASAGGLAYYQIENLNPGDAVITLSGVIAGTLLP